MRRLTRALMSSSKVSTFSSTQKIYRKGLLFFLNFYVINDLLFSPHPSSSSEEIHGTHQRGEKRKDSMMENFEPIRSSFLLVFVARLMSLSSVSHLFQFFWPLTSCSVCVLFRHGPKGNERSKWTETRSAGRCFQVPSFFSTISIQSAAHCRPSRSKKGGKPSRRQSLSIS